MTKEHVSQSVSAARNRLWVVASSMLTGHRRQPMRQQQWVRCPAQSDSSMKSVVYQPDDSSCHVVRLRIWNSWRASGPCVLAYCQADVVWLKDNTTEVKFTSTFYFLFAAIFEPRSCNVFVLLTAIEKHFALILCKSSIMDAQKKDPEKY